MARIKLAYIGGGSTRATGTMASFISSAPHLCPARSPTEPIFGLLLQALSASGVTIDQPLLDHLMQGIPPDLLMRRTT